MQDCAELAKFICKKEVSYEVSTTTATWANAELDCNARGAAKSKKGHLVSIQDKFEQRKMLGLMAQCEINDPVTACGDVDYYIGR